MEVKLHYHPLRLCSISIIVLVIIAISGSSLAGQHFIRGRPVGKHGMLGLPISEDQLAVAFTNTSLPTAQWYDQRLDHFDPVNAKTWKQRYFVSLKAYNRSANAPIFLQLGGEGEASPVWLEQGQIASNYAKHFQAGQFLLEHRFYGKSHPTE